MSDELKPCPFCGGPGYLCQIPSAAGGNRYIWIAKCSTDDGCGVEFLGTSRKVDAIKEWNTRVDDAKLKALVAENKALKEELKDFMCDPSFDCQQCEPLRTRYFDGGNDGQR